MGDALISVVDPSGEPKKTLDPGQGSKWSKNKKLWRLCWLENLSVGEKGVGSIRKVCSIRGLRREGAEVDPLMPALAG